MRLQDSPRGASLLLLAAVLLSSTALAQEPEVPDWAEGWKQTWLEAYKNGSLQLSAKVNPRYLGNGPQELLAVLELRAPNFPPGEHPPASVALIIDHSASTAGRHLLIARRAALDVMDGLKDSEHLAIISVSDKPRVLHVAPLTPENRQKMRTYVSQLQAEGRSDLSAGIDAANAELASPSEANFYKQVIILSDGRPTDGMVDQDGLAELARVAREESSIHTNTVAVGNDADIDLMAGIAKQGWGFAATLNDSSATERVAKRQQLDLVRRAANAVELRVRAGPTVTLVDVMGAEATIKGNLARISVGEIGPGETIPIVLHLSTDNVGKQVRPIDLARVELTYEDALVEKRRTQNLTVEAELNPAQARGRGSLNVEALRAGALAYVKEHTAHADEAAEDGDQLTAKELLDSTRENVKQMGALARLEITDALALLNERSSQILQQARPPPKPDPLGDKKKKSSKLQKKKKR
ncbi:VWA domain-containing protein [Hyalangium minutum]|uniref:von Willebrand factor type A domain protein n=1 Tax=Hyalangium minutum TaxID=394096 RepID=A0A085WGM0_9BACT|nr:VWA domain-containing protein [Hyalangium minutum]KFE66833.1 Von Willebrand factor type A domain protein [Hyalangium minutum]